MSKRKSPLSKAHPFKGKEPYHPTYSSTSASFYQVDDYARLSSIENAKATWTLIELLSRNIVTCGIRVFRIMREIQGMITPLNQADLEKAGKILGITRLSQKGPDDNPPPTRGTILRLILERDPDQARRIALGEFQRPGHRPPDIPLHLLIFYLREHLKAGTRRPHNELVSGFLFEQDLGDVSPNRITKVGKKGNRDRLHTAYDLFRETYEAALTPFSDLDEIMGQIKGLHIVVVDNPTHIRDTILFPSWEDYLPETKK
jgi:hypothetical protein